MKKTTASVEQAVVIILQSVRRTRSRRRDFCVQMGFGVCTNKHPLAKWIARGIACLYLKQPKRPLRHCGKSTEIQVLRSNEYEKDFVL